MLFAAYAYQSYPRPYRLVQAAQRSRGCALHSQRLPSDINSSRDITISSTVDCSHGTGDKKLFFSQKSFVAVGLSDKMVGVVSSMQISTPSKIQAIAFYGVNTRQHCIIADQTGSGKTLAYLLPTVQRMILSHSSDGQQQRPSPFIVVMTPTSELAT
jgi:ATP-dependent RNA helicase DDX18/HAS1